MTKRQLRSAVERLLAIVGRKASREVAVARDFEDRLEAAFWEFDARKKGYSRWKDRPMSERDAFKWTVRNLL